MVENRPCKLSVTVILSFGSYSEDELVNLMDIPKSTLRVYLWRWEHYDHIIERHEILNGSPTYTLTDYGKEYLKSAKNTRLPAKITLPKVLSRA